MRHVIHYCCKKCKKNTLLRAVLDNHVHHKHGATPNLLCQFCAKQIPKKNFKKHEECCRKKHEKK